MRLRFGSGFSRVVKASIRVSGASQEAVSTRLITSKLLICVVSVNPWSRAYMVEGMGC